jgi:2,4-dienoyl-CoA reductase-like NADH-dependent reductase (Old Yellow Enzyme family)
MNATDISLCTPFTIRGGFTVKNRLFKSAMSEQLGTRAHDVSDGLVRLYGVWADGGIGLQVTGNVMVDRTALGEPRNVVIDERTDRKGLEAWARAGQRGGAQIWMQLNHPGKQSPSLLAREPLAPSAVPLGHGLERVFNTPRAMTQGEIESVIAAFATGARIAKESGFNGVQIHGAHGYLVSQFLSPRHNIREDGWGGSPENRRRFVLEVYSAVRTAVGKDFGVGIKLNSADFQRGGFTEEESMVVVDALAAAGMDLIEISGGTYEAPAMTGARSESTRKREAYFLEYAERVRKRTSVPLAVTGGFRSARAMNEALRSGATDFVGMARPLAFRPDFPHQLLQDVDAALAIPHLSTGIKVVDRVAMLDVTWFEAQLDRVARGKSTKENLSSWAALYLMLSRMGLYAFRRRRA